MIEFFHNKDRLRFLLLVCAIAVPILLAATWFVSSMEDSAAADGQPNDKGGMHYRIQKKAGAKALPPALAALVSIPPNTLMTDVNADTDGSGRLTSATIKAFSTEDFKAVAAFHRPSLQRVNSETVNRLEGVRDGYEIRISRESAYFDNDPYKDRTKIEYYIDPSKN